MIRLVIPINPQLQLITPPLLNFLFEGKTLAQASELVPGGVLGVRNPNLRSKMLKNDVQRRNTRKKLLLDY